MAHAVNLAFGQNDVSLRDHAWGGAALAPGYGDKRPSAKTFVANALIRDRMLGQRPITT
jgi:hypothetical protein